MQKQDERRILTTEICNTVLTMKDFKDFQTVENQKKMTYDNHEVSKPVIFALT